MQKHESMKKLVTVHQDMEIEWETRIRIWLVRFIEYIFEWQGSHALFF